MIARSAATLGELIAPRLGSVDPSKYPDECFDLYSIPAFDAGEPDIVRGAEIGSAKQLVEPNDVLLSRIVPHIRRAWIVGSARGRRLVASGEWIVFRSDRFESRFLRHLLVSDIFHSEFMRTVSGVGGSLLRARPAHVMKIRVPLPPPAEQRRIAEILDKADALRAKRRAALAELGTLTQSIFLNMFGDPSTNPRAWPLTTLGDVVFSVSDGPHVSPSYTSDGIPFLSTRHVRAGEILWDDLKYITEGDASIHWKKCRPVRGDVIYTKGGTTGLAAAVKTNRSFAIWVHLALLKPDPERVDSTWLEAMLNSPYCYNQSQDLTRGIANRDLGLTRMVRIKFYRPPLTEQRIFAEIVAATENLRRSYCSSLAELDILFASLQHRAFRGEL